MKKLAVGATIEFHDSSPLNDCIRVAALISDTLGCPVKMNKKLFGYEVEEIKVEVLVRKESDCGLRINPKEEKCYCDPTDYHPHDVGAHDKQKNEVSNIRNKCLCKLIKGIHSLDDHGQEGD